MQLLNFIESINYEKTDKYDLGYIHEFYDRLFSPRQHSTTSLLEIGIENGRSIRAWRDFFPNAIIHGVDINLAYFEDTERLNISQANAYDINFVKNLPNFDIIIDDGPHTFDSMVFFCKYYLPLVKEGGIFVLEDIIDISWTPRLLEIIGSEKKTSVVHMAGLCRTPQLLDRWQNGLDVIIVEV